jgi:hypothetical protein
MKRQVAKSAKKFLVPCDSNRRLHGGMAISTIIITLTVLL